MRFWYIHCLDKNAHERNDYRWKALKKAIEADGGDFRLFNLRRPPDLRALERGNDVADVVIVCDFHSAEILAKSRTDITQRAKFRAYITGAGWRREDWITRGLKGLKIVKPNVVFLSHRVLLDRFAKHHKNVHHVGLGFDPKVFYPAEDKGSGIVFCGNPAMGREKRLRMLKRELPYRVEWKQGLSHAEMADFLRSGLIGWNQIARGPEFGRSCNLRTWETLGCRILFLCSWSKDVPLEDGKECVFWHNDKEMVELARYFLEHPARAAAIAWRGYEEAVAKHTWDHRAQEYLEIIRDIS